MVRDVPYLKSVWLGHFAGGRFARDEAGIKVLDWQDRHVCFETRADCERWQKSMRVAYRRIEGYRTCLPIR